MFEKSEKSPRRRWLDIEAQNDTSELGMTTRERKQTSLYAGDDFSVKAIKSSRGKPGAGKKKKKSLLNPDLSLESDQEMDSGDSSDDEAYQKKKAALMEPDSSDDEEFTKKPKAKAKAKASKPRARKTSVGTAGATKKALVAAGVNTSTVSVAGVNDTAVVSPAAAGNHPDVIDDKGNNYYGGLLSMKRVSDVVNVVLRNLKSKKPEAEVKVVNMVLLACGAVQNCIPPDVDLDALNADEVHELLEEYLLDMDAKYPLEKRAKSRATHLRSRFTEFFATLAEKLLYGISNTGEEGNSNEQDGETAAFAAAHNKFASATGGNDLSVLQVLVDQLVTLSGYSLVNLRDGALEAAAAIGQVIASDVVTRREEAHKQHRLLDAEGSKSGNKSRQSARYKHLAVTIAAMEGSLRSLDQLTQTIFDGCLVNRYKDFHASLRYASLRHIGHWIQLDPEKYMRDEYLKYLGWSLSDPDVAVRLGAVKALRAVIDCSEHTSRMQSFSDRFCDKLSTLAALDTSPDMNLQTVLLLQQLDREGLMDTCAEEVLDRVDRMVFDTDVSEECRSEALVFFMNHTEGFEVDDEEEAAGASRRASRGISGRRASKGTKSSKKSLTHATEKDAQLMFQKAANQLETLCEFVELHVSDDYRTKTRMLVEACLLVEDSRRLLTSDWAVMSSLLLKESDAMVTSTLRPALVGVLLTFFVSSADILRAELDGELARSRDDEELQQQWAALGDVLKSDLNPLLVRFRDEPENISMLVRLFSSIDSTSDSRKLKTLVQQASDIFDAAQKDDVMSTVVGVLARWRDQGVAAGGDVDLDAVFAEMLGRCWTQFESALEAVQALEGSITTTTAAAKKKGRGKASKKGGEVEGSALDSVYSLVLWLTRLLSFAKRVDVRPYLDGMSSATMTDQVVEAVDALLALVASLPAPSAVITVAVGSNDKSSSRSSSSSSSSSSANQKQELELSRLLAEGCEKGAELVLTTIMWHSSGLRDLVQQRKELSDAAKSAVKAKMRREKAKVAKKMRLQSQEREESPESDAAASGADLDATGVEESKMDVTVEGEEGEEEEDSDLVAQSLFTDDEHVSIRSEIEVIADHRDKLVDMLVTWMKLGSTDDNDDDEMDQDQDQDQEELHDAVVRLRRAGFRVVNDLRTLFPASHNEYHYWEGLAWTASPEASLAMKKVFDWEAARYQRLLSSAQREMAISADNDEEGNNEGVDSGSKAAAKIEAVHEQAAQLAMGLLTSLGTSLIVDVPHLNRRQCAAILGFYNDDSEPVRSVVKAVARKVRASDMKRFLEVQLLTLKDAYSRSVAPAFAAVAQREERRGNDTDEEEEDEEGVESALRDMQAALKSSLGLATALHGAVGRDQKAVARLAGSKTAMSLFFSVGVDFAFDTDSSPENVCFLDLLAKYLRLLGGSAMKEVKSKVSAAVAESSYLCATMQRFRAEQRGSGRSNATVVEGGPESQEEEEEEEEEEEGRRIYSQGGKPSALSDSSVICASSIDAFLSACDNGGKPATVKGSGILKRGGRSLHGAMRALDSVLSEYGEHLRDLSLADDAAAEPVEPAVPTGLKRARGKAGKKKQKAAARRSAPVVEQLDSSSDEEGEEEEEEGGETWTEVPSPQQQQQPALSLEMEEMISEEEEEEEEEDDDGDGEEEEERRGSGSSLGKRSRQDAASESESDEDEDEDEDTGRPSTAAEELASLPVRRRYR